MASLLVVMSCLLILCLCPLLISAIPITSATTKNGLKVLVLRDRGTFDSLQKFLYELEIQKEIQISQRLQAGQPFDNFVEEKIPVVIGIPKSPMEEQFSDYSETERREDDSYSDSQDSSAADEMSSSSLDDYSSRNPRQLTYNDEAPAQTLSYYHAPRNHHHGHSSQFDQMIVDHSMPMPLIAVPPPALYQPPPAAPLLPVYVREDGGHLTDNDGYLMTESDNNYIFAFMDGEWKKKKR